MPPASGGLAISLHWWSEHFVAFASMEKTTLDWARRVNIHSYKSNKNREEKKTTRTSEVMHVRRRAKRAPIYTIIHQRNA